MMVLLWWICLSQDRVRSRQISLMYKQLFKNRLQIRFWWKKKCWYLDVFPVIEFPCICEPELEQAMLLEGASSATAPVCTWPWPCRAPSGMGSRQRTWLLGWSNRRHPCSVSGNFVLSHEARTEPFFRSHLWNREETAGHPCCFSGALFPFRVHGETGVRKHSLLLFDGVVTGIAHPDLELEAHDGVAWALAAALPTDGLPAFPAVMLPDHGKEEKEGVNFALMHTVSL